MAQIGAAERTRLAELVDEGRLEEARWLVFHDELAFSEQEIVTQMVRLGEAGGLDAGAWALAAADYQVLVDAYEGAPTRADAQQVLRRALRALVDLGVPDTARWLAERHSLSWDPDEPQPPGEVDGADDPFGARLARRALVEGYLDKVGEALKGGKFARAEAFLEACVAKTPGVDAARALRHQLALCRKLVIAHHIALKENIELLTDPAQVAPEVPVRPKREENPLFIIEERAVPELDLNLPLAVLRQRLEARGQRTARVLRVGFNDLSTLLLAGHTVLLQHAIGPAFKVVIAQGVDLNTGITLVEESIASGAPRGAAAATKRRLTLLSPEEFMTRGAAFMGAALVLLADGTELPEDIEHSELLDQLDKCGFEEDGRARPPAHTAHLAWQVIEQDSTLYSAHLVYTQALLHRMREEGVTGDLRTLFLRWYRAARDRFVRSSELHRAYAQFLALDGRDMEAAAIWSDVFYAEPTDARAALACADALARTGEPEEAEFLLATLLSHSPRTADAYQLRTPLLLKRRERVGAELMARIAVELAPTPEALRNLADICEAQGNTAASRQALDEAVEQMPHDAMLRLRRWRRARNDGDWARATADADYLCEHWPDAEGFWRLGADTARGCAGAQRALEIIAQGARHLGFPDKHVDNLGFVATKAFGHINLMKWVKTLCDELADNDSARFMLCSTLLKYDQFEAAIAVAMRLHEEDPHDSDKKWYLANALLYRAYLQTSHKGGAAAADLLFARATVLLDEVLAERPDFTLCAVQRAALLDNPRAALALLEPVDRRRMPALVLDALICAHQALGDDAYAHELGVRLQQLDEDTILEAITRQFYPGQAHNVLRILQRYTEGRTPSDIMRSHRARALWVLGDVDAAVDEVVGIGETGDSEDWSSEFFWQAVAVTRRFEDLAHWLAAGPNDFGMSSTSNADPWRMRALHAVVALSRGDGAPRAELLERAGEHIGVRERLALGVAFLSDEILAKANTPPDADAAWLKEYAPGAWEQTQALIQQYGGRP